MHFTMQRFFKKLVRFLIRIIQEDMRNIFWCESSHDTVHDII